MMRTKGISRSLCAALTVLLGALISQAAADAAVLTDKQLLGKLLFSDTNLSSPSGQACASCHVESVGFVDPDSNFPTSEGILPNRFGPRNAPTVTYLATAPDFAQDPVTRAFSGGQFLDGRAANLFELAKGPFVNPIEMHSPNRKHVVQAIKKAAYAPLFRQVFGQNVLNDVDLAFNSTAQAVAEFLKSPELNKFNSKFDFVQAGQAVFTDQESAGFELFKTTSGCFRCHVVTPNAAGGPPVFTSFRFANVGVPKNPNNLFYVTNRSINGDGLNFVDLGLGGFLLSIGAPDADVAAQLGKINFPTLRNIALTAPYFHNGIFQDLKTAVHFVNTRDVPGSGFAPPEVPVNVSTAVGNLHLSGAEEDAIVAFLNTLTDDYVP